MCEKLKEIEYKIKSALFGLATGDALGVPVEFKSRESLKRSPVKSMTGYGTWNQKPGTWSDDSSLAFCLAESLTKGYDLDDIAKNFVNWLGKGSGVHIIQYLTRAVLHVLLLAGLVLEYHHYYLVV